MKCTTCLCVAPQKIHRNAACGDEADVCILPPLLLQRRAIGHHGISLAETHGWLFGL